MNCLNIPNLRRLADYLDTLPDDYEAFDMSVFFDHDSYDTERHYALNNGGVDKCGAVACALGHGPSAGFLVPENLMFSNGRVNWTAYVSKFFIAGFSNSLRNEEPTMAFEWMFSEDWQWVDNSPKGAAARIRYLCDGKALPDSRIIDQQLKELYA